MPMAARKKGKRHTGRGLFPRQLIQQIQRPQRPGMRRVQFRMPFLMIGVGDGAMLKGRGLKPLGVVEHLVGLDVLGTEPRVVLGLVLGDQVDGPRDMSAGTHEESEALVEGALTLKHDPFR